MNADSQRRQQEQVRPRPRSKRSSVRAPSSRGHGVAKAPPAPPALSASPSRTDNMVWTTLRRLLFTPPVPLPAMQQKLEMCVAMGTDTMLESTFGSKLAGLHKKSQAKLKKNGIPLAPPLTRKQLRKIVTAASNVGGSAGYVDLAKVHAELIRCFGTKVSFRGICILYFLFGRLFLTISTLLFARLFRTRTRAGVRITPHLIIPRNDRDLKPRVRLGDVDTSENRSLSLTEFAER